MLKKSSAKTKLGNHLPQKAIKPECVTSSTHIRVPYEPRENSQKRRSFYFSAQLTDSVNTEPIQNPTAESLSVPIHNVLSWDIGSHLIPFQILHLCILNTTNKIF